MNKIKLIIGLGNPGKEYENTRHNAGFLAIDELAKSLKAPGFEFNKKTNSEISAADLKLRNVSLKLILAKPQTFMNESGTAVLSLMKFYPPTGYRPKGDKIKPENILIVHDDIDISFGNFKFSFGRHSAGHRGVESIIKSLKTKNFWRLRIGIQPARIATRSDAGGPNQAKKISADKIILKKFTPVELNLLKLTLKKEVSILENYLLLTKSV